MQVGASFHSPRGTEHWVIKGPIFIHHSHINTVREGILKTGKAKGQWLVSHYIWRLYWRSFCLLVRMRKTAKGVNCMEIDSVTTWAGGQVPVLLYTGTFPIEMLKRRLCLDKVPLWCFGVWWRLQLGRNMTELVLICFAPVTNLKCISVYLEDCSGTFSFKPASQTKSAPLANPTADKKHCGSAAYPLLYKILFVIIFCSLSLNSATFLVYSVCLFSPLFSVAQYVLQINCRAKL